MIRFIFGNPSVESLRKEADQGDRQSRADELLRQMIFQGNPADGARLLARHPETAMHDFYTAVATGRLDLVQPALSDDAGLAIRAGGPLGWEPLLYLAYSRLPGHDHHAVAIARLLLDHGASVNALWKDDWGNPFTVLTGIAGHGEGVKPPHPQMRELATLLLAHGAEPYDPQLLYNNSIVDDDTFWLELLWNACEARSQLQRWRDVPPPAPSGHPPVNQLDYLLGNAVTHRHPRRAEWLISHGASPDTTHAYTGKPLLVLAQLQGATEMEAVLRRLGAREIALDAASQFQIACQRGDFDRAQALIAGSPALAKRAEPLMMAAATGRTDLIDQLLALGTPVDIQDEQGGRALQAAVFHDARHAVQHLLARGAEVDIPTKHYGGAMGTAAFRGHVACAQLLAPHSRDVHNMTSLALQERLAELFTAEPALVSLPHFRRGDTPLFWLPEEESAAIDMARFLISRGADPLVRNREGHTAGELASRRGQDQLAQLLGA